MNTVDTSIRFLILNQIINLQREDYEISAVCSRGKWIKEIEENDIRVKTIEMKRKISPISDLIALFQLISFFKKEKFYVVHTHTPKASFLGRLAAEIAGVPRIIFSERKRRFRFLIIECIKLQTPVWKWIYYLDNVD